MADSPPASQPPDPRPRARGPASQRRAPGPRAALRPLACALAALCLPGCRGPDAAPRAPDTGPASPAPPRAPEELSPPLEGPHLRLHDAGGTVLVTSQQALYRASGAKLYRLRYTVDAGNAGPLDAAEPIQRALGWYPENLWLVFSPHSGTNRPGPLVVGKLEGTSLKASLRLHVETPYLWNGLFAWTGRRVAVIAREGPRAELRLRDPGGPERPMTGDERAARCGKIEVTASYFHRGWALLEASCNDGAPSRWRLLEGPRGERVDATSLQGASGLHVKDNGEVVTLDVTRFPAALCRLHPGPIQCTPLDPMEGTLGAVMALAPSRGDRLWIHQRSKGLLEQNGDGAWRPLDLPEIPRAEDLEGLARGDDGMLWALVRQPGPRNASTPYRVLPLPGR